MVKTILKSAFISILFTGAVLLIFYIVIVLPSPGPFDSREAYTRFAETGAETFVILFCLLSLLFWLNRIVSLSIPFTNQEVFLANLKEVLMKMRYKIESQSDTSLVFKPPVIPLFGKKIFVKFLGSQSADMTGPRRFLIQAQNKMTNIK